MDDAPIELSAELLLGHERFVRSIARGLLGNEHDVQDAVQDTWLRALRAGPRAIGALPRWLERVVRSRAMDLRRAEIARRRREQHVASNATAESAAERLSVQHDVVAAVLALHEPYRSVVLLRYYHGLDAAQIATRLHSKAATVRTQLVRAHEILKERLDRDHGRAAWAPLAVPFVSRQGAPLARALVATSVLTVAIIVVLALFDRADPPLPVDAASAPLAAITGNPTAAAMVRAGEAPARSEAAIEPQGSSGRAIPEVLGERATLFDMQRRGSYERSVFSFEHGYGGGRKVQKPKDHGDWDVQFQAGRLRGDLSTDDRGVVVDLGAVPLVELTRTPLDEMARLVREVAAVRPLKGKRVPVPGPLAQAGHSYFVWTNDRDTDLATLFEVVEVVPNDVCVLEWYSTEDGTWARGSIRSPRGERTLAELATTLRDSIRPIRTMAAPNVRLQVRTGNVATIPCRLDLAGGRSPHVHEESDVPVLDTPLDPHEQVAVFHVGGTVPEGMKFVITRATWWGRVQGDPRNGKLNARLHAHIGDVVLVDTGPTDEIVRGQWAGRVEIAPSEEDRVFLQVANTSCGELILEGMFEPLQRK